MSVARVHGHFGEWVQGRLGPSGPVALVTVACDALFVEARFLSPGPLRIDDPMGILGAGLSAHRLTAFLEGIGGQIGRFALSGNILPGGGAGASTASLIALARAAGANEDGLAQACLDVEGATDPLMLPAPDRVLWASRQAQSLGDLPRLPAAEIVGGFWKAPLRTDPKDTAFPDVSDLMAQMKSPLALEDLAAIASRSAERCSEMRGPEGDPTPELAKRLGALGHLRAHTGSARGLIFAPGAIPARAEEVLRATGYTGVLRFRTGGPDA